MKVDFIMCQLEWPTECLDWLNITSVCVWKELELEFVNSGKPMTPFSVGRHYSLH